MVTMKRAWEPITRGDGYRVLVDRLWPRGQRKAPPFIDEWARDLAPSPELRKWFGHDPERWREFVRRYRGELHAVGARRKIHELAHRSAHGTVTLIYASRDEVHNNAVVLCHEIEKAFAVVEEEARPE